MTTERVLISAGGILLFLMWLFLAARGPALRVAESGALVLRYGASLRVFAWITALVIPVLVVLAMNSLPARRGPNPMTAGLLMLAFGVLGGLLLLETQKVVITLTDMGISGLSPWRGPRDIKWWEVEDVSFSALNRWFIVRGPAGKIIRVSCFLVGIRDFAAKVREHVAPERYAAALRGFRMI